jgi:hypothetical protein
MKTSMKRGISGVDGKVRVPPQPSPKPKTFPSPAAKVAPRDGTSNQTTRVAQGMPWQKAGKGKK